MLSFALGISGATGILVGKSVGEESKSRVFKYFRAAMYVACSFTAVTILAVLIIPELVFGIFTEQEEVLQSVYDLMPVYFTLLAVTALSNVGYGMVRGTGKQALATPISLLACLIGLGVAYLAAFTYNMEIVGLLLG